MGGRRRAGCLSYKKAEPGSHAARSGRVEGGYEVVALIIRARRGFSCHARSKSHLRHIHVVSRAGPGAQPRRDQAGAGSAQGL
eukprot:2825081-Prymnesium_polylepis.1